MKSIAGRFLGAVGVVAIVMTLSISGVAQDKQRDPVLEIPLAGKVPALIKRTRVAKVAGRARNFKRLIGDDAQHDALMAKFSEPMNEDERMALHSKQLARYGSQRIDRQVELSDYGTEVATVERPRVARSAAEPKEESTNPTAFIIFAILGGSVYLIRRNT
ncbi:MAG: hypothetical protein ACI97A_001538 [Planctomycetota bacterium]|jgi:hypothetical protein